MENSGSIYIILLTVTISREEIKMGALERGIIKGYVNLICKVIIFYKDNLLLR